ncbi:hypothetical protein [Lacinutrix chionoecetis]
MKPKISYKNINTHLKQNYGCDSLEMLFISTLKNQNQKEIALTKIIEVFTGYEFRDGKLSLYNPYTSNYESLNITGIHHLETKEDVLSELQFLRQMRLSIFKKSKSKLLETSKRMENLRDNSQSNNKEHIVHQRMKTLNNLKDKDFGTLDLDY